MNENTSTKSVVINVELLDKDGKDILHFDLVSESHPQGIDVNLNAEDGQNQLVTVFSCLLQKLLMNKVVLQLKINSGYGRMLFKDVCTIVAQLSRQKSKIFIMN